MQSFYATLNSQTQTLAGPISVKKTAWDFRASMVRSRTHNYDKFPTVRVNGWESESWEGWPRILERLKAHASSGVRTIAFECYPGALEKPLIATLLTGLQPSGFIATSDLLKAPSEIELMVSGVLGGDPVFGRMNALEIGDFFDPAKLSAAREKVRNRKQGLFIVIGTGASLVAPEPDLLVYADLARWEIQQRQRRNAIGNLGAENQQESPTLKYKRGRFSSIGALLIA